MTFTNIRQSNKKERKVEGEREKKIENREK